MKRTSLLLAAFACLFLVSDRERLTMPAASAQPDKTPAVIPETPGKDAEPLPPMLKADPNSTVTALSKNGTLFLEVLPENKGRRVHVAAEVCMLQGPLECLLCKKGTKEHEAIIRTDMDAYLIHGALLAAGAKPGTPVQFVDPKTFEADYKAATGDKIKATVHYTKGGKSHTHPAQEWVWNFKTKKAMDHEWVFAGSRMIRDPDRPNDPPYYTANSGEILSISNSPDATLDLPVEISKDDAQLSFEVKTDRVPPLLSKVWLILEPVKK